MPRHILFTLENSPRVGEGLGLSGLLSDPVVERSDLLDVHLLGGILLLGSEVYLLLDAVSGEGALVLEGTRGDVVVARTLRTETDVDSLHVGVGVPLTFVKHKLKNLFVPLPSLQPAHCLLLF